MTLSFLPETSMRPTDMRPFKRRTGIIWQRLALWALVVAVAGLGLASPVAAQLAARDKAGKLDRFLSHRAANAPDEDTFKVIITLRPGARRGLLLRLRAHGVQISHDHTIINAVAAELPARLIRILEDDKDVASSVRQRGVAVGHLQQRERLGGEQRVQPAEHARPSGAGSPRDEDLSAGRC